LASHNEKINTCADSAPIDSLVEEDTHPKSEDLRKITAKENAVLTTNLATLPQSLDLKNTQVISFGTGIDFKLSDDVISAEGAPSSVVLPCVFGSQLQGPVLLATGMVPSNVPFSHQRALRGYYEQLKSIVVIVNDRMTDNARNLATSWRINALFIVQLIPEKEPKNADEVLSLLDSANINAVTALAGPQSLVLVQISEKYYFYRGIANTAHLDTSGLAFGSDVTSILQSAGMNSMIDTRAQRIINLQDATTIILPTSGRLVKPQNLQELLEKLPIDEITNLEADISSAVPQLQALFDQKDLQELSKALVSTLSRKISNATASVRSAYIKFLTQEYQAEDPASVRTKSTMLGELRKTTKEIQTALEPVISSLANLMSSQTTSKRTHDIKRLLRQAQIQGNVEAAKTMTFDTLAGYLETYAGEMGVMLLNIETAPYYQLLGNLKEAAIDARYVISFQSLDLLFRVLFTFAMP
jgi:hypothetical protein